MKSEKHLKGRHDHHDALSQRNELLTIKFDFCTLKERITFSYPFHIFKGFLTTMILDTTQCLGFYDFAFYTIRLQIIIDP